MRYFKYLLPIVLMYSTSCYAADVVRDLGKYGNVYPIEEQGIHELVIQQQKEYAKNKDSQEETKKAVDKFLTDLPPVGNVTKVLKNRTFYLDGDITVPVDLKAENGDILIKKGTKFNILSKLNGRAFFMFIDGRDEKQILLYKKMTDLLIKNKTNLFITPFLVAGSVPRFIKLTGKTPYYDYNGSIVGYLKINKVPAIAGIDGSKIRIEEIAP